jgi:hypothetical protein
MFCCHQRRPAGPTREDEAGAILDVEVVETVEPMEEDACFKENGGGMQQKSSSSLLSKLLAVEFMVVRVVDMMVVLFDWFCVEKKCMTRKRGLSARERKCDLSMNHRIINPSGVGQFEIECMGDVDLG